MVFGLAYLTINRVDAAYAIDAVCMTYLQLIAKIKSYTKKDVGVNLLFFIS